ncbi:ATP-binding protein [Magnetovibrio sp. PR-2]|uniref:ATP-binding protein n=1 Tax=Magnetovibrio sp. PR-2 TaxID=3120356 RepID=UPI002FCE42EA
MNLLYGAMLPPSVAAFAQTKGLSTTQVSVGESGADGGGGHSHISAVASNGGGCVFVASEVTEHGLDLVMIPSVCACVEATPSFCGFDDGVVRRIEDNDVYLSLTTASAYKNEVALHFYRWIDAKIALSEDLKMKLELALQEALANGLIHGNMGLNKTLPDSFHDLGSYADTVQDKLESVEAGQKRIEVWAKWGAEALSVSILDHGAGFDVEAPVEQSVTGWGLNLIESLTSGIAITEGGRMMTMRFER